MVKEKAEPKWSVSGHVTCQACGIECEPPRCCAETRMNSEMGQFRGEADHMCWFSAHVGAGEAVGSSLGFGATCKRASIRAVSSVH